MIGLLFALKQPQEYVGIDSRANLQTSSSSHPSIQPSVSHRRSAWNPTKDSSNNRNRKWNWFLSLLWTSVHLQPSANYLLILRPHPSWTYIHNNSSNNNIAGRSMSNGFWASFPQKCPALPPLLDEIHIPNYASPPQQLMVNQERNWKFSSLLHCTAPNPLHPPTDRSFANLLL